MRRSYLLGSLALLLLCLLVALGSPGQANAQAGDPYSLIDAVNSLRAANGLPAYEANSILMSVAQGHSDYQAAIGQVTHTGAGGTAPRDRATGAGYGGGGTFFISENIAGGTDLSVDGAISMWLGDDPHIQTMLGANYRDIGAGVAEANGFVYYTIDVAYVAGAGAGNYRPPASITPGGPTPIPIYLVQTATPKPDGSVVHTVLSGQTLEGIATAYGIKVSELKQLNHLTGDAIYVGDTLLIQVADTPGPTSTTKPTITPTRAATSTHAPTRTPTATSTPMPAATTVPAQAAQQESLQPASDTVGNILVVAIIILAAGGVILMVVGTVIKRSGRG